jgi:hypothetical protein
MKGLMTRYLGIAALVAGVGTSSIACRDFIAPNVIGSWGGDHIELVIAGTSATLEYDCAHGTIDQPFATDTRGNFSLTGTHTFEQGGPVRDGDPPDEHPARFEGRTDGRTMSLTVMLTDTDESIGTFALVRGVAPRVFKCL